MVARQEIRDEERNFLHGGKGFGNAEEPRFRRIIQENLEMVVIPIPYLLLYLGFWFLLIEPARVRVYNDKAIFRRFGALAQLGERLVRNEEVGGSIPLCSTKVTRSRTRSISLIVRSSGSLQNYFHQ